MKHFTRLITLAILLCVSLSINAVPAKRGMWRQITLSDGSKVFAELRGDENCHFLSDRQGNAYVRNENGTYDISTVSEVVTKIKAAKSELTPLSNADGAKLASPIKRAQGIPTDLSKFQGTKKGLVILAQFSDVSFTDSFPTKFGYSSTLEMYKDIVNGVGFKNGPFIGSVRDYFKDQSHGQFDLDFDVVGPVTLSQPQAYYGGDLYTTTGRGSSKSTYTAANINDGHASYMAYEAIQKAYALGTLDFSDYDWDGDGECEFVFIIYAGQGQADGGDEWTVWPHKFTLSSGASNESIYSRSTYYYTADGENYTKWTKASFSSLTYNNTKIDTYACANEAVTNQTYNSSTSSYDTNGLQINGIGTICHEFSHCMGYPDMYDTGNSYSSPQMGTWDLMCSGSYNGTWNGGNASWSKTSSGYCPAGYTTFERWTVGWDEPIVLDDPTKVTFLKPIGGTKSGGVDDYGKGYVVYMPNSTQKNTGEYYILENRYYANWDAGLPWWGLLAYYVQYSSSYWSANSLNTVSTVGHDHMGVFQSFGWDYLGWYNFDTYPWYVSYLPRLFSESASFYDSDGATMAQNMNDYFASISVSSSTTYNDYIGFYTQTANRRLDDSSTPTATYYGSSGMSSSSSSAITLTDHEIWNIRYNYDDDATVSFNYRYPQDVSLALDQTTTTEQELPVGYYSTISSNKNIPTGPVTTSHGDELETQWSTIWLPFDMNIYDLCAVFGDSVKLAKFTGTSTDDEGNTTLEFETCTYNGLHAYTPYLISVDEAITDAGTFDSLAINTANADADVVLTTSDGWQMVGAKTYSTIDAGNVFISNGEYWTSQGSSKLKAYRCYFIPASSSSAKGIAKAPAVKDIDYIGKQRMTGPLVQKLIDINDPNSVYFDPNRFASSGTTTGITDITTTKKATDGKVYNLSGQIVRQNGTTAGLGKGIYVINGKKVVIK